MRRKWLVAPLFCLLTACFVAEEEKLEAGARCGASDECESGACAGGLCAGDSCDCGITGCSPSGTSSTDCPAGYLCAGSATSLYLGGRCRATCSPALCPAEYQCNDGLCGLPPPAPLTVSASASPSEAPVGAPVQLSAEASSPHGAIVQFVWSLGGTEKQGATVTHQFDDVGTIQVGVTVTDSAGHVASGGTSVRICLPDGSGCYAFDSQGNCCSGRRCEQREADTSPRCYPLP
ncbi:MAG: PKD domain-containing protein [Polyangiaceae bacterium]|nr:PKD domain-containing protein [Polyangiaceae bacterium]